MNRARWPVLLGLATLSGATLVFEITLMRIFSFTIWHHFAFLVISVALLGFALSGTVLQLRPGLGAPAPEKAARYALLFGLSAPAAVALVTRFPFDPTLFGKDPLQILHLSAYYVILLVPFTLSGLAVLTLLKGYADSVGVLYASDLVGAGLSCFLVVGAMQPLGAEGLVLLAGAVAAGGASMLRWQSANRRSDLPLVPMTVALLLGGFAPFAGRLLPIPAGPGKGLVRWLDTATHPEARLAYSRWSPLARVDVVENAGWVSWTVNPAAEIPQPRQVQIIIDGDAATPIVHFTGDPSSLRFLDYTLSSAALGLSTPRRMLVIGAGGGVDVLTALYHGVPRVDAVEINPLIVDLVTGPYADWSGNLFSRKGVSIHVAEGRSFIRASPDRYDLIQLSLIDTWAASASGAYALAEGYLYTVEAFEDYFRHLTDGGVLTITRWLWNPPRDPLKLCSVAMEALRRQGVARPERHIAVLGARNLANVLVKRSPWTPEELDRLGRVAKSSGATIFYPPGTSQENPFAAFLAAKDPDAFLKSYPYDVSPATDESPFFFQFGRWQDARPWSSAWRENQLVLSGRLVLVAALLQGFVLSVALLLAPAVLNRRRGLLQPAGSVAGAMTYFFLIGLSFMLHEIALMQRLTLFLGNPTYAIVLVLAVLLLAAGLGSAASARLAPPGTRPWPIFAALVTLSVVYAFFLPGILRAFLGLGFFTRSALGAASVFPLGFLLGVPFPAGISALVRRDASGLVSWAWAANGCASVLGPILAVLLAMDFGFTAVVSLAAAGYGGAYAALRRW